VRSQGAFGVVLVSICVWIWGAQFVVGKSALAHVEAFHLSTVRYGISVLGLMALLAWREGWRALAPGPQIVRLAVLGTLGFALFNLLAYTGLEHAQPQTAALITALAPFLTTFILWGRTGERPAATTFATLALALFGVSLVIGRGHPLSLFSGALGWGEVLVFAGVLSFTLYTLGGVDVVDFSPLRYTTVTAALGWIPLALATVVADEAGWIGSPSLGDYRDVWLQILYLAVPGAIVAMIAWNSAVVFIGAQNVALFWSTIPVATFAIQIARGYRPHALELVGAAITVGALIGLNLLNRRRARRELARLPGLGATEPA